VHEALLTFDPIVVRLWYKICPPRLFRRT